jgi:hypothetical protein
MFQVLILICAAGVSPGDCQAENALDVLRGPFVANEMMCGMQGQAYIAPTAVVPRGPGEFVKIKCMSAPAARNAVARRASIAPANSPLRAPGAARE